MRSLYKRQLAMMVGIVALSFTLLSTAFMMLSYRYIISEKRDAMERNAGYIAMFASSFYQQLRSEPFQNYVASIALISDSYVIVAAPDGEIIYATDGVNFYAYENSKVPESVVSQVLERGSYAGMTSLGGIFPERRYLASLPITVSLNNLSVTQGLVGHRHHFLFYRCGGAADCLCRQLPLFRPPGPASKRDGRGSPKIWPWRV